MPSEEEYRKKIRKAYDEDKKPNTTAYMIILVIVLVPILAILLNYMQKPLPPTDQAELKKFSSLTELKDFLKENQGSYGGEFFAERATTLPATMEAGAPAAKAGAEDYSATNIQVSGVDEADIVKNDGKYIYTISGNSVVIIDAYPPESAGIVSAINLSGSNVNAIYINGDRLVVFGNVYESYGGPVPLKETAAASIASPTIIRPYFPTTFIKVYDISDRANPVLKRELALNGTYFNSRMIGDYVYAIVNAPVHYGGDDIVLPMPARGFPEIYYFDVPDYSYQFTSIFSVNVKDDQQEPDSRVFLLGYSNSLFVSKDNIYMVYQKRVKQSHLIDRLTDEILIPSVPADIASRIKEIKDSSRPSYEKQQAIGEVLRDWLQSLNPEEAAQFMKKIEEKVMQIQNEIAKEMEKSVVHKIAVSSGNIEYKTKGEVPGAPLNQFSMDEYNDYFRIATTTGEVSRSGGSSLNHIYVLDSNLNIVGKVEDLAPGERIYSARFIGDRAYLVTFKKVDPLFVIDLKDPQNPRVLGKLKIPGYSDYLHPYDENHIIGVGKEAVEAAEGNFAWYQGIKISLFDVSDVENPKERAKFNIGDRGTDSEALRDHKAFLFSRSRNLLVIPILLAEIDESKYSGNVPANAYGETVWQGAYVFDLTLENGFSLKGKITHDEKQPQKEYYYPRYPVQRSLYIGNALYTVSTAMVKANDLADLREISKVELPAGQNGGYFID